MDNNLQVSVLSEQENFNTTVLRIASIAKNSVTQFYSDKKIINSQSLEEVHQKIIKKLRLHRVTEISLSASIQFENDNTRNVDAIEKITREDNVTDSLTQLVVLKWTFIFDVSGNGEEHMHSIYLRISEGPNPGLVIQKLLSRKIEDIESIDSEAFSPIVCKVDFIDSRFSNEILSVVTEWVSSLPKAEPVANFVDWLRRNEGGITKFTSRTFSSVIILAYIGVWFGFAPDRITSSIKYASAWILGGAVIYQVSNFLVAIFNKILAKHIRRISDVPVFAITSADKNKLTKHISQSTNSLIKIAGTALIYGVFKAIGLYLATYILR